MAIAFTDPSPIIESTATDSTSYTTTASAGANGKLYLVSVINSHATAPAAITCTHSGGLTCVEVLTTLGVNFRLTVFRAYGASGISSGTFTADAAGATQIGWVVIVDEATGMDTSGTHGSGAIVQSAANNGTGTTADVTLAAFADAVNNAAFSATAINSNAAITEEGGYTELGDVGHASPTRAGQTQYKIGQDTSITTTFTNSVWRIIGLEIKMAAAAAEAAAVDIPYRMLRGVGI